ncbi:MAG: uracil-DNA glycosylase family protein [Haloarculaceae archaeon]
MRNVTERTSNPFGMRPPCDRFVPGYGDANAHFHVVGDDPLVHGGVETGVPFTGTPAAERLQAALARAGLLRTVGDRPIVDKTFLSYLHMCVPGGDADPDDANLERFFDAELRAIAAHVLLPVGRRAIRYVLETYTARRDTDPDVEAVHGVELRGSGWLVVPVSDPAEWGPDHADRLVAGLDELRRTDYRRESDLGRFVAGGDPYFVR